MARQKRITVATEVSARLARALMASSAACAGSARTASATRRSDGARDDRTVRMRARVPAADVSVSSADRAGMRGGSVRAMGRSSWMGGATVTTRVVDVKKLQQQLLEVTY